VVLHDAKLGEKKTLDVSSLTVFANMINACDDSKVLVIFTFVLF
jgi:hypothetical protein